MTEHAGQLCRGPTSFGSSPMHIPAHIIIKFASEHNTTAISSKVAIVAVGGFVFQHSVHAIEKSSAVL